MNNWMLYYTVTLSCFLYAPTFICWLFKVTYYKLNLLFCLWLFKYQITFTRERQIQTATCKSLSVAQQFLQFCKVNSSFPKVREWVTGKSKLFSFRRKFRVFQFKSFHFIFPLLFFPFALLTNHITVIRRTLIDSLLADFLLNNLTLKCCTKSSVSCDAANRTCVL